MAANYKHYQIRIHRDYEELAMSLLKFYDKADQAAFVFEHEQDEEVSRTHVHCYLFGVDLQYDAVRERVKKLGFVSNTEFCVLGTCGGKKNPRALDVSGAWVYGSKFGSYAPKFVKNLSPAQVEELNEYARRFAKRDEHTKAAPSQPVVPVKESKKSRYAHVREIASEVLTPEYVKLSPRDPDRIRIVRDATMSYLRANALFCGKYKAVEYIEAVLLDLKDETFASAVNSQLEKNLGINI